MGRISPHFPERKLMLAIAAFHEVWTITNRDNHPSEEQPNLKSMQKSLLILMLATGLAGCAHHRTSVTDNAGAASNAGEIETLMDPTVTSGSLDAALQTFSHGAPPVS